MATMFEKRKPEQEEAGTIAKLFASILLRRIAARRNRSGRTFPERDEYVISSSEFQRVRVVCCVSRMRARAQPGDCRYEDGTPGRPTLKRRQPTPDNRPRQSGRHPRRNRTGPRRRHCAAIQAHSRRRRHSLNGPTKGYNNKSSQANAESLSCWTPRQKPTVREGRRRRHPPFRLRTETDLNPLLSRRGSGGTCFGFRLFLSHHLR